MIAAGADFAITLDHLEHSPDRAIDAMWAIVFHPNLKSAVVMTDDIDNDTRFESFESESGFEHLRSCVATRIEDVSRLDAEALRVPWSSQARSGWPKPDWAKASGLKLDALLYSAVDKGKSAAAQMYLDAGADPLAETYLGDCAARLACSKGMFDVFNQPEWLDATIRSTGESGLFFLARGEDAESLKTAYRLGANPGLRNIDGDTVFDVLDQCFHGEVAAAIADADAMRIGMSTSMPISVDRCVRQRARRL